MKTIEKIVDITTGEETIIEREETPVEKTERLEAIERSNAIKEANQIRENNKAALLAKLGITADEAKLLLS
jgi:hypothetical protein